MDLRWVVGLLRSLIGFIFSFVFPDSPSKLNVSASILINKEVKLIKLTNEININIWTETYPNKKGTFIIDTLSFTTVFILRSHGGYFLTDVAEPWWLGFLPEKIRMSVCIQKNPIFSDFVFWEHFESIWKKSDFSHLLGSKSTPTSRKMVKNLQNCAFHYFVNLNNLTLFLESNIPLNELIHN